MGAVDARYMVVLSPPGCTEAGGSRGWWDYLSSASVDPVKASDVAASALLSSSIAVQVNGKLTKRATDLEAIRETCHNNLSVGDVVTTGYVLGLQMPNLGLAQLDRRHRAERTRCCHLSPLYHHLFVVTDT